MQSYTNGKDHDTPFYAPSGEPIKEVRSKMAPKAEPGLIPRWLFPSLVTIMLFMMLQLCGGIWWAATITERLAHYNSSSNAYVIELQKQIERLESRVAVGELQVQTMRERLAERGWSLADNQRRK